jgi:hypothetical protein
VTLMISVGWCIRLAPGKVEPNAGDHTKATYTAPRAPAKGNQVFVVAYLVNDQAAGLGIAIIKLSS